MAGLSGAGGHLSDLGGGTVVWHGDLQARNAEEGVRVTEQAIRRAAVQCYAIEGEYPPSLEYLKENYGIEAGEYVVHYTVIASNLMPDITVFALEDGEE